ncbi:MAG: gamma carbonic anhydrase family protein, partial [Flavobacteriales bacterium]
WEPRQVIVGNPARAVKPVTDEMIAWKTEGTRLYQGLPAQLHATLRPCEPLREVDRSRPPVTASYAAWKRSRKG